MIILNKYDIHNIPANMDMFSMAIITYLRQSNRGNL